jgi:hypothetical protein
MLFSADMRNEQARHFAWHFAWHGTQSYSCSSFVLLPGIVKTCLRKEKAPILIFHALHGVVLSFPFFIFIISVHVLSFISTAPSPPPVVLCSFTPLFVHPFIFFLSMKQRKKERKKERKKMETEYGKNTHTHTLDLA